MQWVKQHYEEQNAADFPEILRGPWAKLEAYSARFALILHLVRFVTGEAGTENVDEFSVAGSIALIDYFKSHSKRAYMYLRSDSREKLIIDVLAYIAKIGGRISARDLQRKRFRGIETAEHAKSFLSMLVDQGYGSIEVSKTNSFVFTRFPA